MLAYPAPIYVHGRFATVDESGTLYLILGVLSVVAVFGCQLYRKQQNGIGSMPARAAYRGEEVRYFLDGVLDEASTSGPTRKGD